MASPTALQRSLLALRLSVFLVMFMWTLDKFVNPEHAIKVYQNFYGLGGVGSALMLSIGIAEMALLAAFFVGLWRRWTYGAVFLLHAISTLASFRQYLSPWDNLLFFAAWPMLAACYALYVLRDEDVLLTVRGARVENQRKQRAGV
jgi:putative oxidoreductase